MSAITSHFAPSAQRARPESEAPKPTARISRDEEFRLALDRYITDYRKHRALMDSGEGNARNKRFPFFWLARPF